MICAYHNGEDVESLNISRISDVSWYKKTSPGFSWGKIWCDLKLITLVRKEIKKFQPDVIHAHLFESLGTGWVAGLAIGFRNRVLGFGNQRKIPIVLDLQGDLKKEFESYNKKNSLAKIFFVAMSKWLINKADAMVVSSENALESAKENYKNPDEIMVIKDGIDLEMFRDTKETEENSEVNKIKTWQGSDKLLVYTGGLENSKGVGELLNTFNTGDTNGWKLLLFGQGADRRKYVRMYVPGNVHDVKENYPYNNERIWFSSESGYFSLPNYLRLTDAAIDPKRDSTESSGKLVNYMAAGLPIICFDNDFNRSVLRDQGIYINEMGQLSDALKKAEASDRINYDLEKNSEEKEAEKLFEIIGRITSANNQPVAN